MCFIPLFCKWIQGFLPCARDHPSNPVPWHFRFTTVVSLIAFSYKTFLAFILIMFWKLKYCFTPVCWRQSLYSLKLPYALWVTPCSTWSHAGCAMVPLAQTNRPSSRLSCFSNRFADFFTSKELASLKHNIMTDVGCFWQKVVCNWNANPQLMAICWKTWSVRHSNFLLSQKFHFETPSERVHLQTPAISSEILNTCKRTKDTHVNSLAKISKAAKLCSAMQSSFLRRRRDSSGLSRRDDCGRARRRAGAGALPTGKNPSDRRRGVALCSFSEDISFENSK